MNKEKYIYSVFSPKVSNCINATRDALYAFGPTYVSNFSVLSSIAIKIPPERLGNISFKQGPFGLPSVKITFVATSTIPVKPNSANNFSTRSLFDSSRDVTKYHVTSFVNQIQKIFSERYCRENINVFSYLFFLSTNKFVYSTPINHFKRFVIDP